jgi:hypothetical protein
MTRGRLCFMLCLAAWPLFGCVQQSTTATSAQEADKPVDEGSSTSNRRRTTIYTTDALASPALAENGALSAAFIDTGAAPSKLADATRNAGAYAAADFYDLSQELRQTRVVPPARPAGPRRPLACVFSTDDATVVRERDLALKLNAANAQESARLSSQYDEALASASHDCRLLAGWSIAVLRSAKGTERSRAHELATRRLLELANGQVAPSRMSPADMYVALAHYFSDHGDAISAIAALEYALNTLSADVDASRRTQLARWQERLLTSSNVTRHAPS